MTVGLYRFNLKFLASSIWHTAMSCSQLVRILEKHPVFLLLWRQYIWWQRAEAATKINDLWTKQRYFRQRFICSKWKLTLLNLLLLLPFWHCLLTPSWLAFHISYMCFNVSDLITFSLKLISTAMYVFMSRAIHLYVLDYSLYPTSVLSMIHLAIFVMSITNIYTLCIWIHGPCSSARSFYMI